jgi:hypothetical protein
MKQTKYHNRYGDEIIFKEINENQIEMIGGEYYRTGYNEDGIIDFVDPSGGPFIQLGTELGRYFNDNQSRIVKSIIVEDKKIYIEITNK